MSIRWDPLLCAAAAVELNGLLSGERALAVLLNRDSRAVALFMRNETLVVELAAGWVGTLPGHEPPAVAHRLRHRISAVEAPFDESMITIRLVPSREREEPLVLVLELIGTRRNALVVEDRGRVIRHVLSPRDGGRPLEVGARYEPPTPTGRAGPDTLASRSDWNGLLTENVTPDTRVRRRILEKVAFTSSLNVDWLLEGDPWERWNAIVDPKGWRGHLVPRSGTQQPYPVPVGTGAPYPDLLSAFGAGRAESGAPPLRSVVSPGGAASRAQRALDRVAKRLGAMERELGRIPDPVALRGTGDLLLARLGQVQRGTTEVSLTDFEGSQVHVGLDPALAPAENAAAYYDRAGRAERARQSLPDRIDEARAEAREIERLLAEHEAGDLSDEALLAALGPDVTRRPKGTRDDAPSLPYRSLWSSGGLEIRVGRGARHNDDLTFHHSAPDDIWLHALQTSGAHVILRWGRKERPPRRDLAEAATLAALNSGARHSGSVAVGWTRRKYVRKPRGAAPGAVAPERVETIFASPDSSLPDRLGDPPSKG